MIHTPECAVYNWCGGGTSGGETDVPPDELFVITGGSRADVRTDAPITFLSCPLHTPSGRAQMLLKKMLNLDMRMVISPPSHRSVQNEGWLKSQNEEQEIWMVPRFVLLIMR